MLNIAIGMLIASGVLIATAVILFYVWKVPSIVAELSGKTTRQNIKKLQKINSSDEMTSTDFYNAMTSGALDEHEIDEGPRVNFDPDAGMSGVLSSITLDEDKRSGRRRKSQQRVDTSSPERQQVNLNIGANESSSGLTPSILGQRVEAITGSLDYAEDVSTGYFVDEDEVPRVEAQISPFSSSRVVLVTREYSSLEK